MNEAIWDRGTAEQIGWVADSRDVFSSATKQKIATVRDGNLYSLTGEPLNLSLDLLEGGASRGVSPEGRADAVARFKRLTGGDGQ
jgi:hypothetical protein